MTTVEVRSGRDAASRTAAASAQSALPKLCWVAALLPVSRRPTRGPDRRTLALADAGWATPMASTPGTDLASGEIARKSQSEWTGSRRKELGIEPGHSSSCLQLHRQRPVQGHDAHRERRVSVRRGTGAAAELSDSSGKSPVHRAGAPAALGVNWSSSRTIRRFVSCGAGVLSVDGDRGGRSQREREWRTVQIRQGMVRRQTSPSALPMFVTRFSEGTMVTPAWTSRAKLHGRSHEWRSEASPKRRSNRRAW